MFGQRRLLLSYLLRRTTTGETLLINRHRSVECAMSSRANYFLRAETTQVRIETPNPREIRLKNSGKLWALGVWVDLPGSCLSDNYLFLAPGGDITIGVEGKDATAAKVACWNPE